MDANGNSWESYYVLTHQILEVRISLSDPSLADEISASHSSGVAAATTRPFDTSWEEEDDGCNLF